MIKEIAFTCYPVKNLKKARSFYEEILGLKPTHVFEKGEMGFIEYDIGSSTFAIGSGAENFVQSKEGACVAFEVEDFEDTINKLRINNVQFIDGPNQTPVCQMAIITDPEGSKIIIHKRKQ